MAEPEEVTLESMDIAEEKREQIKALFPEAFSQGKIDFDQLKRSLGEWVEPAKERFGLNWPGKADCMKIIQEPSVATLKPARDESVNFDDTENLFIEGDNLEVLKLLQKSYFGKVKMIYIDPPYNTGKEFIYPDKFAETLDTYLEYTGQKDGNGKKLTTNADTSGRYHSRWLNMMYPRLYLAKNLLREDGVIFISIDDHEYPNLKQLCDLIFGEENAVGTIIWKNATDNNPTNIASEHEYIICYAKGKEAIESEWKTLTNPVKEQLIKIGEELAEKHTDIEDLQNAYTEWHRKHKAYL
jgi:adenine-specific DNA-methyltransferase